jgi:hypothetical protein
MDRKEFGGFGRLPATDPRDKLYSVQKLMTQPMLATLPKRKLWNPSGWWGDQGNTSQCVGYSVAHLLEDGPITQTTTKRGQGPILPPDYIYHEAQKIDEWAGEGYEGTSVRAGVKVAKREGFIDSFYWVADEIELRRAVQGIGPVLLGCDWTENMVPDRFGFLGYGGRILGGHAILINGVDEDQGWYRLKNSWGRGWGSLGHCRVGFTHMSYLLFSGEGVVVKEINKKV